MNSGLGQKALVLTAVLAAAHSCVLVQEERNDTVKNPFCTSDRDCDEPLMCDQRANICALDKAVKMNGWVRLVPPAQGLLALEEHYASLEISTRTDLTLTLHRPLKVVGRVVVENNPLAGKDAVIVALAEGSIPDLEIHVDTVANNSPLYDDETGYTDVPGFEFFVNEGRVYDIFVYLPEMNGGGEVPPHHVRRSFTRSADAGDPSVVEWDIVLPSPDQYLHVRGCIEAVGKERKPLVGGKVYAASMDSAKTSTTALTDEEGCFDILVQPPDELIPEVFSIRLNPTADNELIPNMELAQEVVAGDVDLGRLVVPGFDHLVPVSVVLTASAPIPTEWLGHQAVGNDTAAENSMLALAQEVRGTTVSLATTLQQGSLRIERTAEEVDVHLDGSAGLMRATARIDLKLPASLYAVNIIPRPETRLALYQQILRVDPISDSSVSLQHELKEKSSTEILLHDYAGMPVSGASILAVLSGKGKYAEVAPLPQRKSLAIELADEPGTYLLSLDPGEYTLQIEPPPESGLPSLVERNIPIKEQNHQRLVTLPQPVVVTGRVMGTLLPSAESATPKSEGAGPEDQLRPEPFDGPAQGVKVELYDEIEGAAVPDGVAPIPMATGWTDSEGRFVLILPVR